ncbi:hypothetical protein A0J61_10562 [Choanephora cucurbitarum]|uniref:Uncharacterized protein n=1 Tax=Choanephora cucurbitarum TaxID=101091 RepID=A0A1C7MX54_9FUNG|nr:hypothetical protein A0J61_10562 [Choanephora cucurbitarum]
MSGSNRRKRQTDPNTQARKRDFSVYTCDNHLSQLVSLMECKPPRASPSDDFVKMANCLKDCLDKAIKNGVDHSALTVCGLLYESGCQRKGQRKHERKQFGETATCACHHLAPQSDSPKTRS